MTVGPGHKDMMILTAVGVILFTWFVVSIAVRLAYGDKIVAK